MQSTDRRPGAFLIFTLLATLLSAYFGYAAIRGDLGVIERLVVTSQVQDLTARRAILETEIEALRNKTLRMSDDYLDLDLLDEQARTVLGMMRADELVIRETTISGR